MTRHTDVMHRNIAELESKLDHILDAPLDNGPVEMIVRRPTENEREIINAGELDEKAGLVGDDWSRRGEPFLGAQLTLMNSRVVDAVATSRERWPLAGDQIYVDMDLSRANLPPGTRLAIGDALIEVSATPHTGCAKFADRYGKEALRWVNVGEGKERRFRGMYAFVVQSGAFSVGDEVRKVRAGPTTDR